MSDFHSDKENDGFRLPKSTPLNAKVEYNYRRNQNSYDYSAKNEIVEKHNLAERNRRMEQILEESKELKESLAKVKKTVSEEATSVVQSQKILIVPLAAASTTPEVLKSDNQKLVRKKKFYGYDAFMNNSPLSVVAGGLSGVVFLNPQFASIPLLASTPLFVDMLILSGIAVGIHGLAVWRLGKKWRSLYREAAKNNQASIVSWLKKNYSITIEAKKYEKLGEELLNNSGNKTLTTADGKKVFLTWDIKKSSYQVSVPQISTGMTLEKAQVRPQLVQKSSTGTVVPALLTIDDVDFAAAEFPSSVEEARASILKNLRVLSGMNLTTEQAYVKERVVSDMNESLKVFLALSKTGNGRGKEKLLQLLESLNTELISTIKECEDDLEGSLDVQLSYIKSRQKGEGFTLN